MTVAAVEPFVAAPVPPERLSMSFLRAAGGCLRRAHMERQQQVTGLDALVGHLFHEAAAAIGFRAVIRDEREVTIEDALAIARRTMASSEDRDPLPKEAWDQTLGLIRRWAPRAEFRPGELFEVASRRELHGRILSARIDRLALDRRTAYVRDYKTGWAEPSRWLSFQGELYAWHVFQRHSRVDTVIYTEEVVRHGLESGPWEITRDWIDDTEEYLLAAIARIDTAYAESRGELPATPGAACSSPSRCPVAGSCPVPEWARPATVIETEQDALAQFEALLVEDERRGERVDQLRGWLEANGRRALELNGMEIGRAREGGKRLDRRAVRQAGIDLSPFEKPTPPSFGRRKAA